MTNTAFYQRGRATALRMLGDKGRAMTLHKRTAGTYDPDTGTATPTEVDHACQGAEFDYPALVIDGTRIQVGDKKVILVMQDNSIEPDVGDEITGSARRNVVAAKAISPAGIVVAWQLQVRR